MKLQINKNQYLQLLNEKMKEHSEYEEGMHVEFTTDSPGKPWGVRMIGEHDVRGIVAWAEEKLKDEYELID